MSEEEGEEIGADVYDNEDDGADEESSPLEESIEEGEEDVPAQPVEIVREEILTVAENPNADTFSDGSTEDYGRGDDLYELVKAHSGQLSRLTDIVESLQSQIKQLEGTRLSGRKTSSATRTSSRSMKRKKNKEATSKKSKGKSSKRK
jgi:hypothetical protein